MPPVSPSAETPRRPRRWRWLLLGVVGLFLLAGGGGLLFYLYSCHEAEQELQAAVAELDRTDPRWRYEAIEADRANPPEGHNSAEVVTTAARLLPSQFPSTQWTVTPVAVSRTGEAVSLNTRYEGWLPNVRLDASLIQGLRSELQNARDALAEARRLADMPEGRFAHTFPLDFALNPGPQFEQVRTVGWLLAADADARASAGDMAGAWESVRAKVNAGRSLGDQPMLLGAKHRNSEIMSAVLTAEGVMARGEVAPKNLVEMRKLLEREDQEAIPNLVTAIQGQRALDFRTGEAVCTGQFKGSDPGVGPVEYHPSLLDDIRSREDLPWLRRALASLLRDSPGIIDVARAPTNRWLEAIKREHDSLVERWDETLSITSYLAVSVDPCITKALQHLALTRCARTAFAAEQFRQEKGRWPDHLAELIPAYLPAIPEDPYAGAPLRMKRTEDGLVIYTVGEDGADDGGDLDRKEEPTRKGADIGFRLWDVSRRGLPPEKARP